MVNCAYHSEHSLEEQIFRTKVFTFLFLMVKPCPFGGDTELKFRRNVQAKGINRSTGLSLFIGFECMPRSEAKVSVSITVFSPDLFPHIHLLSLLLPHSLTHSPTHSLTHPLTHPLTHSQLSL